MGGREALAELAALRADLDHAAEAILAAAEAGLAGAGAAAEDVRERFCDIIQACGFQDLAGQRIDTLRRLLAGEAARSTLLNGPARQGEGLGQLAADRLFEGGEDPF